jgi:hypothetical protein
MSTRGTLRIEDVEGRVVWVYISHDSGEIAEKRIRATAGWVRRQKRSPSALAVLANLRRRSGQQFAESAEKVHPFAPENYVRENETTRMFGGVDALRRVFGEGPSSPFNEHEYRAQVVGGNGRWDLVVEEITEKIIRGE